MNDSLRKGARAGEEGDKNKRMRNVKEKGVGGRLGAGGEELWSQELGLAWAECNRSR